MPVAHDFRSGCDHLGVRRTVLVGLREELTAARGIWESGAPGDAATRHQRVTHGQRFRLFADGQGARPVAIEDEARVEVGAEDRRLFQKVPYLDRRPFAGRRRLKRRQRDIGGKQR